MTVITRVAPQKLWMAFVSVAIVMVLSLQVVAVVRRHAMGWPFIDYPMYSSSHREGERVDALYSTYATLADGSEVLLAPDDVGLRDFWLFRLWVEQPLLGGRRDELRFLVDAYRAARGGTIVALRIEDYPVIVTRSGAQPAPPPRVLASIEFAPSAEEE